MTKAQYDSVVKHLDGIFTIIKVAEYEQGIAGEQERSDRLDALLGQLGTWRDRATSNLFPCLSEADRAAVSAEVQATMV